MVESPEPFLSTLIGRFGNRICKGKFILEGKEYNLAINNGVNHLHGGPTGYHARVWDAEQIDDQTLKLRYFSPDGEEGYPGTLQLKITYTLDEDNTLRMVYEAETDKATVWILPMNRSVCPKATIIPSYWKRKKAKKNGLLRQRIRPAPSVWTAGPPSPAYSSIPATMSMKTMWTTARPAAATLSTALSAWRPSTTPAAPIILSSRQRYCVPARNTASPLPTDSP